jgi:ABC-type bacteriocin/lantibiotic exporter with double-glycine peptidase domain
VTTIVTTHRPSVLHQCSRAYRVENGQVTQLTPEQIQALLL